MEIKDGKLPKNFKKEFQTKETFQSYFESLYRLVKTNKLNSY
jgi:hypothetical protein